MTLDELKRLAQAATPGPWKSVGDDDADTSDRYGKDIVAAGITLLTSYPTLDISHEQSIADANFVAAANPERVLAMIAVIEAAKAMRDGHNAPTEDAFDTAMSALESDQ